MCGLAGILRFDAAAIAPADEQSVRHMCDLQQHRGPDDAGIETVGPVCLGSRRLAIIDLSAAGHMPMSDASGRWWIAFNGEIYNFAAIRNELEQLGHRFRSHCDTEVVLHAWMQWGSAALQRFVGMFAFALYDREAGALVLARDRYGKKPLYYMRDGERLVFASELKALASCRSNLQVDQRALVEWLLYRNVDSLRARTLIRDIHSVLPGQLVMVNAQGLRTEHYYSPENFVSQAEYARYAAMPAEAVVDEVDSALNDAVQARLVSDVPVGTLLSGGLDSSLVTAIAGRCSRELTAFHVSVEGYPNLDERRFAERLTSSLGLPFVPFSLTGDAYLQALPQVAWLEDLPLTHANSVPYYLISRVARQHGVIVVQSGEGSDELFGGYAWNYRRRRVMMRLTSLFRFLPEKFHSWLALATYTQAGMPALAHRFREQLPPAVAAIDGFARADRLERCEAAYSFVPQATDRALLGAMLADINDFLAPLLRRLDRNSMGASVECRAPFLDHRLVHRAINMPLQFRVGKVDKWVVKQVAARYMPGALVTRRKAGFPLPVHDYIELLGTPRFFAGGFCEQALELSARGIARMFAAGRPWGHGVFGLVALELWGQLYFMGRSPEQLGEHIQACRRPG